MHKIITVFTALSFMAGGCEKDNGVASLPATNAKPNILLIIADDMGIESTPGYTIGSTKPHMPNLENLASKGVVFDNAWAYPVCSPTRSSILTGRYGYRTGVLNAEDASTISAAEKTIHTYLNENTGNMYKHAIFGKWHLSNKEPSRPTQMGIEHYAGLLGGGVADYNSWSLTENGQSSQYSGYITTKITDLAIDWLQQQHEPWFCWVAYTAPHTPFHLPPDKMHAQGNLPSDQASIDANPLPYFMAMVESVDYEMGRLLASLPSEQEDNTVIIFMGDNGSHAQVIQSPYRRGQSKGSLYQGGIHVPLIVAGKGVTRLHARDNNLISSTDLFSTIAEMAGLVLPTYQDSYSFNPLLSKSGLGLRKYNYSEILDRSNASKSGYTIRNHNYKLIQFDNAERRFYDLSADPYEQNNLRSDALTVEQQTALQELINKVDEIRQ